MFWRRRKPSAEAAPAPTPAAASAPQPGDGGEPNPLVGETPDHVLRRLEWTVIRRLDGLLQGDYRTLMRGAGLDLADLREYQHHDDVRHIDWNVTARLQQPHVRQYTEDREMAAWFLVDLSPSADFGSQRRDKRALALEFTAVLARLLTRHGNRVGALLYSRQVDTVLPAGSGRLHVLHLLAAMQRRARVGLMGPTRLGDLLGAAVATVRRRSAVFVVSDFISEPGWEAPLGELARRHDVVAVRLVDPLEKQLPDLGLITLEDPETGEQIFVDTHDLAFCQRFEAAAAEREQALAAAFRRAGVEPIELDTTQPLIDTLRRFTAARTQRRRTPSARRAAG